MEANINKISELLSFIKYPSLTEKSISLYGNRQYTFIVDRFLKKNEIKFLIENLFNVTVTDVRTSIFPIKKKRVGKYIGKKTNYKKAFVKLKEGNTITELFN
jgi:large subunit ribosomal protein L23